MYSILTHISASTTANTDQHSRAQADSYMQCFHNHDESRNAERIYLFGPSTNLELDTYLSSATPTTPLAVKAARIEAAYQGLESQIDFGLHDTPSAKSRDDDTPEPREARSASKNTGAIGHDERHPESTQASTNSELPSTYGLSDVSPIVPGHTPTNHDLGFIRTGSLDPTQISDPPEEPETNVPPLDPALPDTQKNTPDPITRPIPNSNVASSKIPDSSSASSPPPAVRDLTPSLNGPLLSPPKPLPLMIRPPLPPVAQGIFTTHITPYLLRLTQDPSLSSIYAPELVTREPHLLERGHWLIPFSPSPSPSPWPPDLQTSFWNMLERFIGKGRAGWGVWCVREPEGRLEAERRQEGKSLLGSVKVYCWGEVVRHIYLLLYVASRSKVRKMGLVWIDSAGQVVVRMKRKV